MPAIMALEGPQFGGTVRERVSAGVRERLGAVKVTLGPKGRNAIPMSRLGPLGLVMRGRGGATRLDGVTDTIKAHPWAIVAGLLFGAYALTKGWSPGMIWGEHHAAQTRERSLHGRKRRR